jgi:hypothetical protein
MLKENDSRCKCNPNVDHNFNTGKYNFVKTLRNNISPAALSSVCRQTDRKVATAKTNGAHSLLTNTTE